MKPKTKEIQTPKSNGIMYVAGINKYNQIYYESNNHNSVGTNIVCPPIPISLQTSDCLSYSTFCSHSVTIMNNEPSATIGPYTGNPRIQTNRKRLTKWSKITIEDISGNNYKPASAVCGLEYTLYLLNPLQKDDIPHLAYFYEGKNDDNLLFLYTKGQIPIALYGGSHISAAITKEGSVLIIDSSIFDIDDYCPRLLTLPKNEKAVQVAFLNKFVYVLSSTGKVYRTNNLKEKQLKQVKYLEEYKISQISGSKNHILVVTDDGRVLGHGQNRHGQLGIGENIQSSSQFELIESLSSFEISAAYAGSKHSLFQTSSGAVLACGSNSNGQLLLKDSSDEIFYNPTPTIIDKGAVFCIAGAGISCVFVSCKLPPKMPNMKLASQTKATKQPKEQKATKKTKSDKIKEIFEIQSQVREMKNIFEAKNNRIIQLRQENMNIIKNIENIILKIDQNKPIHSKQSKKTPNKSPISNTKTEIQDDDDDDFDTNRTNINSKTPTEYPNQIPSAKEIPKKTPVVHKKPSGPLLFQKKDVTNQETSNPTKHEEDEPKEEDQAIIDKNDNDKNEDEKPKEEVESNGNEEEENKEEVKSNENEEEENDDSDDSDVDINDERDDDDDDDDGYFTNKKEAEDAKTTNKNEGDEIVDNKEEEFNDQNEETTNTNDDNKEDAENENNENRQMDNENSDEEVDNNKDDNDENDEQNMEATNNNEKDDDGENEKPNVETNENGNEVDEQNKETTNHNENDDDDREVDENNDEEGSDAYDTNYSSDEDN